MLDDAAGCSATALRFNPTIKPLQLYTVAHRARHRSLNSDVTGYPKSPKTFHN
jgi:hypothetical protein